jgi:heptosyltransferase-2
VNGRENGSPPTSLLICRLSALGDIVLTLPTVHALRRAFPDARLEFLARSPLERIFRDVAEIDALHGTPGGGAPPPDAVRERQWDVVLDLSGSGRTRQLLRHVPHRRLLRVRKQSLRRFAYVHARRFGARGDGIVPAVERMLATAAPLGIDTADVRPDFGRPAAGADGPVLVAPGAGRETKRWGTEQFCEVARALAEEDGRNMVVLGAGEERSVLEEVAAAAGGRGRAVACDDPAELPVITSQCVAAVTNDSAHLHIAEACGLPVVAVFGPTRPALGFAPRDPRSKVVHTAIDCSPCDLHGPKRCPRRHHRCLKDIGTDEVLRALRSRFPAEVRK